MLHAEWVHYLREMEVGYIDTLLRKYQKESRILEIGSGDGFMAFRLHNKGWNIIATDPLPRYPQYCNIKKMSKSCFEYPENYFDIIFSSNVLEHIEDIDGALVEMKRILNKDGIMIHTMPTVWCAFVTLLINPFAYLRNIVLLLFGKIPLKINREKHKGFLYLLAAIYRIMSKLNPIRFLLPPGHGISRTIFHSFMYWRRKNWIQRFEMNLFKVIEIKRIPFIYSMHKILPFKMQEMRRVIGKKFGAVDVYVVRSKDIDV